MKIFCAWFKGHAYIIAGGGRRPGIEARRGDFEATSQNALRDIRKILWRADNGATSRRRRSDFAATSQKGLRDVRNCPDRPRYVRCEVAPLSVRHRSVIGARYRRAMNSECRATHFAMSLRSRPVLAAFLLHYRRSIEPSLVPRPSRRKEGLVSTACACAK